MCGMSEWSHPEQWWSLGQSVFKWPLVKILVYSVECVQQPGVWTPVVLKHVYNSNFWPFPGNRTTPSVRCAIKSSNTFIMFGKQWSHWRFMTFAQTKQQGNHLFRLVLLQSGSWPRKEQCIYCPHAQTLDICLSKQTYDDLCFVAL